MKIKNWDIERRKYLFFEENERRTNFYDEVDFRNDAAISIFMNRSFILHVCCMCVSGRIPIKLKKYLSDDFSEIRQIF